MTFLACGLDLGQASDYSAFCAVEATPSRYDVASVELVAEYDLPADRVHVVFGPPVALALRGLERIPLGTTYPNVVEHVIARLDVLPGERLLGIDVTGVGRPVADMFAARSVPFVGVSITGGAVVTGGTSGFVNVPKRDLIHGLLVAFQQARFTYPKALASADDLIRELQAVELKVSLAGHDTYEAWREGTHDDLVLAVAVACWLAEHEVAMRYAAALAAIEGQRWQAEAGAAVSRY